MSYQVLARKWRPRDFAGLVGQEHVVRALSNGLNEGRVHHAFLFTGTRGVGKTTIARILAKSLNCLEGVSAVPCGKCQHCVAIDEGRFVDLLEIDAASRTKVDDTREILDNVQYAPARGRYKVYLIDEVHMLSTHSFNALLKTLEEPPDHVKFVLATTDPQKIPVTILSRCMQFNLRHLSVDQIGGQLHYILDQEQIRSEPAAVALLARAADGSMRDGLSLLDQALAAAAGVLETSAVEDMLGTVEQRHLASIVEALIAGDAGAALAAVGEVFSLGRQLPRLLADLAELLHRVALIQQLSDYRDDSRTDWDQLVDFAARLDPEDVQLYYQIVITGSRDLKFAPSQRTGCEMTLLRMFAFRPAGPAQPAGPGVRSAPAASRPAAPAVREAATPTVSATTPAGTSSASLKAAATIGPEPAVAKPPSAGLSPVASTDLTADVAADETAELSAEGWPRLIERLALNGPVRAVAGMLAVNAVDEHRVEFALDHADLAMMTARFKASLTHALNEFWGVERRIEFKTVDGGDLVTPASLAQTRSVQDQSDAEAAIANDPVVQKMQQTLDAEIVPGSVRPTNATE
ncbi:MAG: DNA polymerase III subunit gamma/tau [Xanthomonadaceae bacterium]|nr:DNA polymerase III subunit gamma/tau [Xanthomonadaceae bacterium]